MRNCDAVQPFLLACLFAILSCRERIPSLKRESPTSAAASAGPPTPQLTERPIPIPTIVDVPVVGEDSERWLWVEQAKRADDGAWATGSFDASRNKLTIETFNVARFTIDTAIVRPNWNQPVVLSIDRSLSELRRRQQPVLTLTLDAHGAWVVQEAKSTTQHN